MYHPSVSGRRQQVLDFRASEDFRSFSGAVAERKGFEPLRRFPAYTLSRRAPSTTRPSLRIALISGWNIPEGRLVGRRERGAIYLSKLSTQAFTTLA